MHKITVLIADDETSARQYLAAVIQRESLPVKRLLEAENGLDALALALENKPDLVFLDIRMPGQDGLETARRLVKENFPGKIVIVSAYNEFSYAQKALRAGVTDYLVKPVKPAEFSGIIYDAAKSEPCPPHPGTVARPSAEPAQPAMVSAVLKHIAENLNMPLRLEDIAHKVYVSPWHLSRTFKRLAGKSIADSVREARIRKAAELLATTGYSIIEIAGMVGFENAGYFATCFKRLTGTSPSDFRKARKDPAGPL